LFYLQISPQKVWPLSVAELLTRQVALLSVPDDFFCTSYEIHDFLSFAFNNSPRAGSIETFLISEISGIQEFVFSSTGPLSDTKKLAGSKHAVDLQPRRV